MKRIARASRLSVFLLLIVPSFLAPQDNKSGTPALSLRECLVQALANNLSLSVEAFNPGLQDAAAAAAREEFLPQLGASLFKQKSTSLGVWGLQGTSYPYTFNDYSFTLTQKVVTGTTAVVDVGNTSSTTGQKYSVINPSYYGLIQLTITQPFLKGFGPKVNRATVYQAERQKEIATAALKARVLETLYDTEQAYWNLYSALENLKVQESSLAQSREVLKRAKEGERIGNQSALDVLNAEASVAGWEDGLVSARLRVEQSESSLRQILNLPPAAPDATGRLVLSDTPSMEKISITYEEALAGALVHRPEIAQAVKQMAIYTSQAGYQANQLLPQLDLTLRGWSQGQSGIKYIYQDDNPLTGIIVDTIVGSRWDAFHQALKGAYKSWSASLTLTIPVADVFSRARLTQAKLQKEQGLADLESQKQAAAFEVAEALKQLHNAELRMQTSAANRALQEKRLAAVLQRYQLGLVDSQWLFEYQRQLASARTSEVQAVIDYRMAAALLGRAVGTTLEAKGLKFRDYAF
jgi:outer membrane protein TolC